MLQNGSFLLYKLLLCALNQAALKRADEKSNISASSSLSLPQKDGEGREGEEIWSKAVAFKNCTCNSGHIFYPPELRQE